MARPPLDAAQDNKVPIQTPTIFISYARSDKVFAGKLGKALRSAGANIWLDQLDILSGDRWDDAIEKALQDCKVFLIILSPKSVDSDNVKDELNYALEDKKQIIPVLYRNCQIPFRLRRRQHSDFTEDFNEGLEHLLKALNIQKPAKKSKETPPQAKIQKTKQQPAAKHQASAKQAPKKRKKTGMSVKALLGGVICLGIVLAVMYFFREVDGPPANYSEKKSITLSERKSDPVQPVSKKSLPPEQHPEDKKTAVDFSNLSHYKIGIYIKKGRQDLLSLANDTERILIENGFQGVVEIYEKDAAFYSSVFSPKSKEIRYDNIPEEYEAATQLETGLNNIFYSIKFKKIPVTNRRNGKIVTSKNFISIFLGP